MSWSILKGDCLDVLRTLDAESVQTCVTSPPYWGLRDYGNDGQLGLESTPEEYVANLVGVFREVRRVLRDDGTLWLNLGDSYSTHAAGMPLNGDPMATSTLAGVRTATHSNATARERSDAEKRGGLPEKNLMGMPWRVAFALQADGWILRSDIVWAKPNPMPESVTDRPTKAHEMLFLFSKAKWTGPEPGRFAHISDEDARWLALLFDAEGNIVIKRAERDGRLQYGAQVTFSNTHRGLIERARDIVGMGSIHERSGTNAPMFYWQMSGRQARDLLHRIYPFLIVKPRQAAVAIYMQDVVAEPKRRPGGYRSPEHAAFLDKCWQTIKALNSFGDPDLSWVKLPNYGRWTSQPYFYDAEAIKDEATGRAPGNKATHKHTAAYEAGDEFSRTKGGLMNVGAATARNKRSVWTVTTQPFPGAHFATFPPKLIEPCVLAGSPPKACGECGAPWERITEREDQGFDGSRYGERAVEATGGAKSGGTARSTLGSSNGKLTGKSRTVGSVPTCPHNDDSGQATVLDPFSGAGTTGIVATRLDRDYIGIELNPEYAEMSRNRIRDDAPLLNVNTEAA